MICYIIIIIIFVDIYYIFSHKYNFFKLDLKALFLLFGLLDFQKHIFAENKLGYITITLTEK